MTPIKTLSEAKKEYMALPPGTRSRNWHWFESTLSSLTEQMIPEEMLKGDWHHEKAEGIEMTISEMRKRRKEILK